MNMHAYDVFCIACRKWLTFVRSAKCTVHRPSSGTSLLLLKLLAKKSSAPTRAKADTPTPRVHFDRKSRHRDNLLAHAHTPRHHSTGSKRCKEGLRFLGERHQWERAHNRPGLRPRSERHRFSAPRATISAPRAEKRGRLQRAGDSDPRYREMDRNPAKAASILRGECQTFSALRAENR